MIHLTSDGIYVGSEEERLAFLDRLHAGGPVVLGPLMLYEVERRLVEEESDGRT